MSKNLNSKVNLLKNETKYPLVYSYRELYQVLRDLTHWVANELPLSLILIWQISYVPLWVSCMKMVRPQTISYLSPPMSLWQASYILSLYSVRDLQVQIRFETELILVVSLANLTVVLVSQVSVFVRRPETCFLPISRTSLRWSSLREYSMILPPLNYYIYLSLFVSCRIQRVLHSCCCTRVVLRIHYAFRNPDVTQAGLGVVEGDHILEFVRPYTTNFSA